MRLSRRDFVPLLTIVAGGVIGAFLTLSPRVLWSPSEDVAQQLTPEARTEEPLEFKLVLPVTELESALARIDRQIVEALGVDELRALGRDTQDPSQDTQNLIFGGDTDQSLNLRPFTSLLASGDVEGAYLVAAEDVEDATLFLGLPEVQRALPRNVSLHWEAELIGLGQRTYRRLYVTEEDAFVTGDMLEDATDFSRRFANFTAQHIGDRIAIVLDGDIVSTSVVRAEIATRGAVVGR